MTTFALLLITGLGLGALYFLIAAGLSLIWGLMRVLNFAHGAFFTVAAYAGWWASGLASGAPPGVQWILAVVVAIVVGGVFATLTEVVLVRPLYARHVGQVLVTVGLALATAVEGTHLAMEDVFIFFNPAHKDWRRTLDRCVPFLASEIKQELEMLGGFKRLGDLWQQVESSVNSLRALLGPCMKQMRGPVGFWIGTRATVPPARTSSSPRAACIS